MVLMTRGLAQRRDYAHYSFGDWKPRSCVDTHPLVLVFVCSFPKVTLLCPARVSKIDILVSSTGYFNNGIWDHMKQRSCSKGVQASRLISKSWFPQQVTSTSSLDSLKVCNNFLSVCQNVHPRMSALSCD